MARQVGGPKTLGPTCGANTAHGPCKQPAGNNTPHLGYGCCSTHRGSTPNHVKHWEGVLAQQAAEAAVVQFGLEVEVSAEEALLGALWRAQGMVYYYRDRVAKLTDKEMVYGTERVTRTRRPNPDAPGVIIEDTTVAKTVTNVWVTKLEMAEKHLLAVSSKVAELNIEHRRVQLAREYGQMFFLAMGKVALRLGISEDDPRLPIAVGEVISELTGGTGIVPGI